MAWTPLRCDGLLIGAGVAYAVRSGRRIAWASSGAALPAAIVASALVVAAPRGGWLPQLVGVPMVELCAAVVIANLVTEPDGLIGRVLSVRPLAAVGRASYGIYLYHYPLLLALESNASYRVALAVALPATGILAWLSLVLVENPVRRSARARLTGSAAVQIPGQAVVIP